VSILTVMKERVQHVGPEPTLIAQVAISVLAAGMVHRHDVSSVLAIPLGRVLQGIAATIMFVQIALMTMIARKSRRFAQEIVVCNV
jgi:hypothetical protein